MSTAKPPPTRPAGATAVPAPAPVPPTPSFAMRLKEAVVTPVQALRWRYVPLLMVYFAYGVYATLIATAVAFWVRKSLTLTPAEVEIGRASCRERV